MGFVNEGPWANFKTEAPDTLENGCVGTNQLVDGAVTAAKMDASLPTTPITNAEIDAVTQA